MGGFNSKKNKEPEVDLWDSRFKKVDRERERRDNDWANNSTTSYNLFDLEEQGFRASPDPSPLDSHRSSDQELFESVPVIPAYKLQQANPEEIPEDFIPQKAARLPVQKNYYVSPKRGKKTRSKKPRPPWDGELAEQENRKPETVNSAPNRNPEASSRKFSTSSDISTVVLPTGRKSPPTFTTVSKPLVSPTKSPRKRVPYKSKSDPSLKNSIKKNSSYPPKRQPKPSRTASLDKDSLTKPSLNNNNEEKKNFSVYNGGRAGTRSKTQAPSFTITKPANPPVIESKPSTGPSVYVESPREEIKRPSSEPIKETKREGSKIRQASREPSREPSRERRSQPSNKGEFTNLSGVKSASVSLSSTVSNFATRTKVITFNDKKCTLGSIGMAQITKLENQFKLRQFPSGIPEGLTRCLKLLKSGEWEQEVEGLELLNSLAQQAPQALINEEKQVRNQLLLQIKNLRSQVTRSACQCAATLFLHLGRDMEPDLEKVVRELLVKSSDTNKFIRSDAMIALEVMAENVSVNKAVLTMFNLGRDNKSPVIRTNMTKIIDIVITRLGAERLMGSSEELQEAIFKEGSKLLTDGSLDVRQHAKHMWSEISEHQNTGKLLEKYLEPGELRAVNKVLDGLH